MEETVIRTGIDDIGEKKWESRNRTGETKQDTRGKTEEERYGNITNSAREHGIKKKHRWRGLKEGQWSDPLIRDEVIETVETLREKAEIPLMKILQWLNLGASKYYDWKKRYGQANNHNGKMPKKHWLLPWEQESIIRYARRHIGEGYRRLTYMMMDENVVAVSPSSVYRVLKRAGLLNRWNKVRRTTKGQGYVQPNMPHKEWHTDIKYVNFKGTFLFLISIIDGYSRFIIHHELRQHMQEYDVQITIQKATEKYPYEKPRLITDNGSQFISRDFTEYLRNIGLQHTRTSIGYPQSNGKIERFHRTIHEECLMINSIIDMDDARSQISKYIDFYNTKRLHSSLNYLTPEDYMGGRIKTRLAERERKIEEATQKRYDVRLAI